MAYSNLINIINFTNKKHFVDEMVSKIQDDLEPDSFRDELREIKLKYNYYPVEILISKCKGLLHSLLEKRDEIKGLEVSLLNQAMTRALKDIDNEKAQALQDLDNTHKEFLSKGFLKNIEFEIDVNKNIKAKDSSIKNLTTIEKDFKDQNEKYRKKIEDVEVNYESYTFGENSGVNFLERIIEKKEIYHSIFKEFYANLISLKEGFSVVYNINRNFPELNSTNLLNEYYKWLTDSIIALNELVQDEQEVELIISLKNGVPNEKAVITDSNISDFNTQVASGLLHFKLPKAILNKKFVRLRSVDLQTDLGDGNQWFQNEVFSCEVKLPNQKGNKALPKLRINAQHYFKANLTYKNDHTFSTNIDPFSDDEWQINIPARGCFHINSDIPKSQIRNIFLILRVAYLD